MMSRMLISSSCVLVFLLCLSHETNGRHLGRIEDDHLTDDKAKLLSHSTIKVFGNDPLTVHDVRNLRMTEKGKVFVICPMWDNTQQKDQTSTICDDDHKHTDCELKNKKDIFKDQKVIKKGKDQELVHHHHGQRHSKSVTFRVHKRVHDQHPGFNLDYSPPKTHPPSHN